MAPRRLVLGTSVPNPTKSEFSRRVAELDATIETYLPAFSQVVKESVSEGGLVVMCQSAFAAGLDDDEYTLMGMAMKYAGLHGVTEVRVIKG
jgi:hypothetical protein